MVEGGGDWVGGIYREIFFKVESSEKSGVNLLYRPYY